jgi:hypothetical protein
MAGRDLSMLVTAARKSGHGSESKLYIWLGITVCVQAREGYTPNSQEDTHGHGAWTAFVSDTWGKTGGIWRVEVLLVCGIMYQCREYKCCLSSGYSALVWTSVHIAADVPVPMSYHVFIVCDTSSVLQASSSHFLFGRSAQYCSSMMRLAWCGPSKPCVTRDPCVAKVHHGGS